jgi:hypothetical protein
MTTAYSRLQREAFSLPNEVLVLDPDEAVSLGEAIGSATVSS